MLLQQLSVLPSAAAAAPSLACHAAPFPSVPTVVAAQVHFAQPARLLNNDRRRERENTHPRLASPQSSPPPIPSQLFLLLLLNQGTFTSEIPVTPHSQPARRAAACTTIVQYRLLLVQSLLPGQDCARASTQLIPMPVPLLQTFLGSIGIELNFD